MTQSADQGAWVDLTAPEPADVIATAVSRCPDVVALSSGGLRPVATYLTGRQVPGVHVDDDRVRVALVGAMGVPIPTIAAQVRAAVAPFAGGRAIDVDVVDIQPAASAPAREAGQANELRPAPQARGG